MLKLTPKQVEIAFFFLDCAILDYKISVTDTPSHVAAAVVRLAIILTKPTQD